MTFPGVSRVWIDITTSLRAGDQANGTTRVEQSLSRELAAVLGERLAFCRYGSTGFVATPAPDFSQRAESRPDTSGRARRGPGASHLRADRIDRRLERAIRRASKRILVRLLKNRRANPFPGAAAGDLLLMAGENWNPRYDYDLLRSLRRHSGLRIVALCQDLIPITDPQFFDSAEFVSRYRAYVDFLLRDTDLILAISKATATELEKLKRAQGLQTIIETIRLGSDVEAPTSILAPLTAPELVRHPFVLSVSSIQARKNFDLLYRVWKRFAECKPPGFPKLVIVGQRGFGSDDLLWQIAHDPAVKDRIVVLQRVSDAELVWLYTNCSFTAYPSFAEGWGLPITESLSYGKFCVASDKTAMPEAGQGLCIHLDPLDVMSWYKCIEKLIENESELREHERSVRARYKPWSWKDSAQQIANVLATFRADTKTLELVH